MKLEIGQEQDSVSAADFYRLLLSTLEAEPLEQIGFGETVRYASRSGMTLLERQYGILKAEGIVNANRITAFGTDAERMATDTIQIDGQIYQADEKWDAFLGYSVSGYYKEDSEGKTVVYLHPKNNDRVKLANVEYSYSGNTIEYEENGKTVRKRLEKGYEYVYNGKTDYSGQNLFPTGADLTLLDNDTDGRYEVVFVEEYYYMTVSAIDTIHRRLFDQKNSEKMLTLQDALCYITRAGEEVPFSGIKVGDVLAVCASKDQSYIKIEYCEDIVSGTVAETDRDQKTITIDETQYKVSDEFFTQYFSGIKPGASATFTLGRNGEIIAVDGKSTAMEYGYLTDAKMSSGIGGNLQVKIFTTGAEFLILDCGEKIVVDGQSLSQQDTLEQIQKNGTAQLVKYALSGENKLSKLDLARVAENPFDASLDSPDDSLRKYQFSGSLNYRQRIFYPYFNIEGAIVFKIPTDVTDEEGFFIGHNFSDGNYTTVTAYDLNEAGTAKVVVYQSDDRTIQMAQNTPVILVESVVKAMTPEGESLQKVYAWESGRFVEYFLDQDVTEEIKSGDLVRIATKGDKITGAEVDFRGETLTPITTSFNKTSSILQYQGGMVYDMEGSYLYLSATENGSGGYDFAMSNLKNVKLPSQIVLFDRSSGKIRPASAADVKTYLSAGEEAGYIVVKQHYMSSQFAVIYTGEQKEGAQ